MTGLTPDLADLAAAGTALAMARTAIEAATRGQGWRENRRRRAPKHKHGRVLYLEVVYNLIMCRHGQRGRPPMLFLTRREWSRPSTRDILVQLLPVQEMTVVATPYTLLDSHEWPFAQHWTEQVPVRWGGYDVVLVGQLADRFADAERVLRRHLYSPNGQAEIGEMLPQVLPAPAANSLRDRALNTLYTTPKSWQLTALGLVAVAFAWRLWVMARPLLKRAGR